MQNFLLAIGFAIIATVLAALAAPYVIDWNGHRALIAAEASRALGAPVTIEGDLSVSLVPTASLRATRVTIGGPRDGARIGRIEAELLLTPLLRGRIELGSLALEGADITVSGAGGLAAMPDIENLEVRGGTLSVIEAGGAPVRVVDAMRLTGEARGAAQTLRLEGRATIGGRAAPVQLLFGFSDPAAISARLRSADPQNGLTVEAVGAVDPAGGGRFRGQTIVTLGSGPLQVQLAGPASATRDALVFDRAEMTLGLGERAARAQGALRFDFGAAPRVDALVAARQIDLDRIVGVTSGGPDATIEALRRHAPRLGAGGWSGVIGLDVGAVVLGRGVVADLRGDVILDPRGLDLREMTFRLPGQTLVEAAGAIALEPEPAFDGRIMLTAPRPNALANWFEGATAPTEPEDPVRAQGRLVWDSGRIGFEDLSLETTAGAAAGRIALERAAVGRNRLDITLAGEAIDLDLLARVQRAFARRLDPQTDWRLDLGVKTAAFAGMEARGLRVAAALSGRTVTVSEFAVDDALGARIALSGALDADDPRRGKLTGTLAGGSFADLAAYLARHEATRPISAALIERAEALFGVALAVTIETTAAGRLSASLRGKLGVAVADIVIDAGGTLDAPASWRGTLQTTLSTLSGDAMAALTLGDRPANGANQPAEIRLALSTTGPAPSLDALLRSGDNRLRIVGLFGDGRTGFRGRIDLAAPDLAPSLPLIGYPAGLGGPLSANGSAGLGVAEGAWRVDGLSATVGGRRLTGDLAGRIAPDGGLSDVTGAVRIDRLDLAAFAAMIGGPAWLVERGQGGAWSDAAFGQALTDRMTGRVDIAVDAVEAGLVELGEFAASFERAGAGASVTGLSARIGPARLSGDIRLDRGAAATRLSGALTLTGAPFGLILPGAEATMRLDATLNAEGASPAALMAGLSGAGRLAFSAGRLSGADPGALARVRRAAELAQDRGRPVPATEVSVALDRALAPPIALQAGALPFTLSGARGRIPPTPLPINDGLVSLEASVEFVEGVSEARLAIAPAGPDDASPRIGRRFEGAIGRPTAHLEAEDVEGYLAVHLIEREALALDMAEGDRRERARQRALTRLPRPEAAPAGDSAPAAPAPMR